MGGKWAVVLSDRPRGTIQCLCACTGARVYVCVRVCVWNPARTLAAAILSRENREQRERSRYAASWGKGMGTAGSDPLLGARPEDLGRAPTPLEEEIFKHAAEVSADPSVITAYFPPVARDHPSVHPSYSVNRDKKDKPVSWIYCMTVSVWHSCSREAEIVAANTVSGFCVFAVQNSEGIQVGTTCGRKASVHVGCVRGAMRLKQTSGTQPSSLMPCCLKRTYFRPICLQLNLDNTWGTTKEGFELCTVMGSLCGIKGAPIASIYVGDKSSATVQRALQWVTDVMARHKVLLHPEVVIADDDKGERKAIFKN